MDVSRSKFTTSQNPSMPDKVIEYLEFIIYNLLSNYNKFNNNKFLLGG